MTTHTQLLNALINKHDLKSYLEIGIGSGENFAAINAPVKFGVDPEVLIKGVIKKTSDEYFKNVSTEKWDLIFIDGYHEADQVKRDFENSLKCLTDNGYIILHDVLPENEEGTLIPRITKKWWGDVYRFAMTIGIYEGIEFKTLNIDNGCMIIKKNNLKKNGGPYIKDNSFTDWQWYQLNAKHLMNIVDGVNI